VSSGRSRKKDRIKSFQDAIIESTEETQRMRRSRIEQHGGSSGVLIKLLEALIAPEETEMEQELQELEEVRYFTRTLCMLDSFQCLTKMEHTCLQEKKSLTARLQQAKSVKVDFRLVRAELKHQAVLLRLDEFLREAQCIKLWRELQTIYPITLDSQKGYLIRDLRVPLDIYTTIVPEEELTAASGFTCHLLFMLSKYLSVNLRHRLFCKSSRSAIQQDGGGTAIVYPLFMASTTRIQENTCNDLESRLSPKR
jgi:hypothetical protein